MASQTRLRKIPAKVLQIGLLLLFILLPPLPAGAGILDGFIISPTGTADITINPGSSPREGVRVVAVQPWDGAILIGGDFTITGGAPAVTLKNLARITNEGLLDTAFAPEPDAPVNAIVIEQDKTDPTRPGQSRIYIGGEFSKIAGADRNGLARFNGADSTLDTLFAPATDTDTVINAMVLQSQKIVIGGIFSEIKNLSTLGGEQCRNLAAISIAGSDGELVGVFSGGTNGVVNALLLQEGSVIAGGGFTEPRQRLARFLPGYALDGSFPAQPNGVVRALALQADGKIVAGGDFTSITTGSSQNRNYLARLTSDGEIDPFDALLEPAGGNYVASLAVQPDGKIIAAGRFVRNAANPKQNLARFTPEGSLDEKMDTETNDVIHTIALQPNGKFLIGGRFTTAGGKPRSRLARFYFHGGLDDDSVPVDPSIAANVFTISELPDGTFIFGGWTPLVSKLNPDFSWDDSFFPTLSLDGPCHALAVQPDGKIMIGGNFQNPRLYNFRLDENGELDEGFTNFLDSYPPVDTTYTWIVAQVLLPKGSRTSKDNTVDGVFVPKGSLLPEKMMYLGGRLQDEATQLKYGVLVRVNEQGEVDDTFQPPYLDGGVRHIAIQPDNKILVAGEFTGKIMRLHTNGDKDETFRPWTPERPVNMVALQRDGRIIMGGEFKTLTGPSGETLTVTGIVRLNNLQRTLPDGTVTVDGSPDGTINLKLIDHQYGDPILNSVVRLANGKILINGFFTEVVTEDGTAHERDLVAVINEDGTLDTGTKFLTMGPDMAMDVLLSVAVQPDGKIVMGGSFNAMWWGNAWVERPTAEYLTRVSHGWATEELTVAPDGKSITWLHGGTAPDYWQVFFEETETPDDPASWNPLPGDPEPITGGWRLSGQNLPLRENRYVRARGYTAIHGPTSANASLHESVRQYYLKEPIKVKAEAVSRVYGQENPVSYTATYFDAGGQPIVPAAGTFFGAPAFSTTRTSSSPVGTYAIAADVSGMSSPLYSFIPEEGTLTVTKRSASVEPDDITKVYGETVEYGGTLTGFLPGDNVTATYSHVGGNTVAGSPHTISATLQPVAALANYDITYGTGNLTFTRKAASVMPNPASKEYGSAVAEVLTGTLSGFLESDGVSATYSRAAGDTVTGTPYTISATLSPSGVLDNYSITYGTADFTITKKAASVTPDPATKEYGSTAAELLTGTLSGFLVADNVTAAYSRVAGDTVAGGPYPISAALSPAGVLGNYDITYNTADFTITRKAASVTPAAATKEYGATDPGLSGSLSGFLAADNVTASYSRAAGDTVAGGPYPISATLSPAGVLGNYDITYDTAGFTITRKAASVTPAAATKEYGATDPGLSGSLSGFLAADNVTASYSRAAGDTVAGGPYPISATLSPAGVLGNYDITYNTAGFTITRKAASVTPAAATKEYGSADPGLSGSLSGFLAADNVTAAYSRVAGDTVAEGPYPISATLSPAGVLGNYDITYNTADFTITKRAASVTPTPFTRVYGSTEAEVLTGTLNGFLESDGVTATYSRTAGDTVAGSPYPISATLSPAGVLGNYDITYNTAFFAIGRRAASVTPNPADKVYGSTAPETLTGTLSGFLDADNVTAVYSRTAGDTVAGSPYSISATLSPAPVLDNYDITYNTAPFSITKKAASVTPNAGSKVYGTPGPDPLSGTLNGFLAADGVTASYSRAAGETVAGSPYVITATLAPAALLGNYDITYGTAEFTITKKAASVTPVAATKEYGSPDPATFTGNLSGFLPADGVTASYSRTPGETSVGSPYAISATLGPAAVLGNYDITYNSADFVIVRRAATVTAVSASKRYGEGDPPLLAESLGFLPADLGAGKITATSSRPSGENAGDYLLTPAIDDSGTGLLANYDVVAVPGTLTILRAPLTITADDKSRTFGAPNPEFTASYSGFAGTDTIDSLGGLPAFTTTADAASPSGSYPIIPSLGSITSANYDFSFVNGILTILGGAPQTITFIPMRPKTYGDGDFDPGAKATSNLAVSYASSAPGIAAVVGNKIRVLAPGNADITASQEGNELFAAAESVTRGLTVNPPPWNGVSFDGGDDFIEVADAPQLNFGSKNGFSIETWLYLDGPQPDGTGLLSKGEGGEPWNGYQLLLHQNRISAEIGEGTATVGVTEGFIGSSNLADGSWHHVAVTVDRLAATATLYLDGRVEAQITHAALAGNPDNAAPLRIGRERSGSRFFKGRIDEVRLWDTVRSRDDIRGALSQIIDPLDQPHLVAYFHLDEGDVGLDNAPFATAPERTSYAADGTLQNFALTGGNSNWISSGAFLPLLETSPVGSITPDGARWGGTVYPNYYPATEVGLCWGTSPNPGESDSCRSYGSAGENFTGGITPLNPGTTYHVRGYARNRMGTAFGNDVTFQTLKLDQTITFAPLEERTYGDAPFPLNGGSSSGLTVSYTSSAPDVAEVTGDRVRIHGAGSATITAWQGGNATYNAALPVARSFTVQKKPVTVAADDKSRPYLAENPILTASYQGILAGDEGAVTGLPLLSTTATPESPVGSYPITAAPGTLAAANYRFLFVNGLLTVQRAQQQITFNPMRPKTFGDRDFDPGATASSNLPVAYASSAPGVAAVSGSRLKVVAPGTAAITASQAGNGLFDAASDATRELVVNPPPWNALGFDGRDDVLRVADGPQLAFGGETGFTVESWLYLDGAQPDGSGVLSKGEGGSGGSGFGLLLHENRIAAEIGYGAGSVGIADGLIGSSSLNDGEWHHVALTVDLVAATASLYLDGRLEAQLQSPLLGGSFDNQKPLQIGVDRSGSRFFKGRIDELRLWSVARSREEIRGSVSQIIDPAEHPDLVAYFHLDEGDAELDNAAFTTAPERTENAADGAVANFALNGTDSNWVRSGAFLPLLETAPVTLVTSSAATGGGVVYPNYYPATDFGLCWSTAPNPTLADSCSQSGSGDGPFVGLIAGLTPGVTYHVRGFATNRMGTAYGNDVTFSAARLDQSITFGPIGERTYGDPGFPLVASASSGLAVTYTSSDPSVAAVENGMIIPKRAGRAMITASQGGNQTYNAAPAVSHPFTVNKKELTVSADAKSRAYRTPNPTFTVSYQGFVAGEDRRVISGAPQLTTVASLDSSVGSYPIVVGLGTLSAENYRFLPVNGTLTVFQSCQEIIFPPIGDSTYGDPPVEITASSCSGLSLSFSSSNPLVAVVSGNLLTITGAGSSVITASQRGNGDLQQAPDVSQSFVVHKRGQAITFPPLPQKVLGDDPLLLQGSASSGLPVTYASSDPAVAAVSGSTLTIAGAGTAVITARQEGNVNFHPAFPASQPFTVAQEGIPPTLALSSLPSGSATAQPVLNVAGSAHDASGITSLTVNDSDLTGSAALFSSAIPLAVGANSITVTAKDGAGNVAKETLRVTLDATAPAIAVTEPADNSVSGLSLFTAQGRVPAGSSVTMAVNGGAPQPLSVSSGTFSGTGYLQPGLNTVELTAQLSGRTAQAKRSVVFAAGKPAVAVTEPGEDLRTEADALLVKGRVGTEAGASVRLEVNGALHTPAVEGGAFQQQLAMDQAGEYRITVTATDQAGNSSSARRNVIKVNRISGDLDRDGIVDIGDAIALFRISLGIDPATEHAVAHGDLAPIVNGVSQPDGKIGVGDVLVLLRKIVGLID